MRGRSFIRRDVALDLHPPRSRIGRNLAGAFAASALLLITHVSPAKADVQTAEWLGTTDGQFSDATRWSGGVVPNNSVPAGAEYNVDISAAGQPYTVYLLNDETADQVTLNSPDATLWVSDSAVFQPGTLYLQQGTLQGSSSPTLRNATVYDSPGATLGGFALDNVTFATDATLADSCSFPSGLNLNGHTITFAATNGSSSLASVSGTISGPGEIVSDSKYYFEGVTIDSPGATLTIGQNVTIRTGTGVVQIGPSSPTATDTVVNNAVLKSETAFNWLNLTNVSNHGAMSIASGGRSTLTNVSSDATINVTGQDSLLSAEKLVNDGAINIAAGGAAQLFALENHGTISVDGGSLTLGNGTYYFPNAMFSNTGTITLHDSTLGLEFPAKTADLASLFTRTGTKQLVVSAALDNTGQSITVSPTDQLHLDVGGTITGGSISGASGGFSATGGTLDGVSVGADLTIGDRFGIATPTNGVAISNGLTLTDSATVRINSSVRAGHGLNFGGGDQTLGGNGTVIFDDEEESGIVLFALSGQLTIGGGVTVETGNGDGVLGGRGSGDGISLINQGIIRLAAYHHLDIDANTISNQGRLDLAGGSAWVSASVDNSGTFTGPGDFTGNLSSSGSLSPGTPTELLKIHGNLSLANSGVSSFQVDAAQVSSIDVLGTVTLGGTLSVSLDGDAPTPGTTLTFLSAEQFSGSFAALDLPSLPNGWSWDTSNVDSGMLAVVPEPCATGLVVAASALGCKRRRRR